MTTPLWTLADLIAATGATLNLPSKKEGGLGELVPPMGCGASPAGVTPQTHNPDAAITGISIDTRTIAPGDLFVALKDVRDGHDFVETAFQKGAAAALVERDYVRQSGNGVLLRVDDPLKALESLGRAARTRLSPAARVIAVTGSAGKTTTKEMLRACLSALGATHASEKSYNNHWGVPLTLARMPADTRYAVFEIGMNHAGEITPLTKMVRPHVAIVTTVEAVHLEHFASVEKIAEAKAEIFSGLEPPGVAVIPGANEHYELLAHFVDAQEAKVLKFGGAAPTDVLQLSRTEDRDGQRLSINMRNRAMDYRVGMPGDHIASNSMAIAAALDAVGLDLTRALLPLADFKAPQGRGSRSVIAVSGGYVLLIDESYNANPASMRAALETMELQRRTAYPRRVAILGDMLELGPYAPRLHAELASAIEAAEVDKVLSCGPLMKHLHDALPAQRRGRWALTAAELEQPLLDLVSAGDVIMIKGSNGMGMARLVEALKRRHTAATT